MTGLLTIMTFSTGFRPPAGHVLFGLLLAAITVFLSVSPLSGIAKELELTGTIDCGRASGAQCTLGDTLAIWTQDVDGTRRRVTIDITWVLAQLSSLQQDDHVRFEVRDLGDGRYQAISVHGPPTSRLSNLRGQEDDKAPPIEATPTPTPLPAAQPASTPTPTALPEAIEVSIADGVQDSSDSRLFHFDITLNEASTQTVTVRFSTEDGIPPNAYVAPADYDAVIDLLVTFPPGTTLQTVDVDLNRSNCSQTVEHFFGTIHDAVNAEIVDARGIAEVPPGPC